LIACCHFELKQGREKGKSLMLFSVAALGLCAMATKQKNIDKEKLETPYHIHLYLRIFTDINPVVNVDQNLLP
jgi:hypothetical protein